MRNLTSIRKVAKDANVSIATVSRVLNHQAGVSDDVKQRVLESINRCGYVANVGRRSNSFLALVYTGPSSVGSAYDGAVCAGMVAAMDESDLDLVVLNLHRDKKSSETYTQFFLRKGVRGVLLRTTLRTRSICEAIAAEGFPTLVIGDCLQAPNLNYVYCDSKLTSQQGVEHLIGLGHRRIAIAVSDIVEDTDHADRLAGYEAALQKHNIEFDRSLCFHVPPSRPDGAQLIRTMTSIVEPPTAVFFTDPLVAVGAITETLRRGIRVPQDLSILGFDDTDVRNHVFPKMTAICQDARRLGYEAFLNLSQIVAPGGPSETLQAVFPTWLEINNTTGPPRQHSLQILPDGTRVVD